MATREVALCDPVRKAIWACGGQLASLRATKLGACQADESRSWRNAVAR